MPPAPLPALALVPALDEAPAVPVEAPAVPVPPVGAETEPAELPPELVLVPAVEGVMEEEPDDPSVAGSLELEQPSATKQ
jgi:hypothetical protein